MITAKRTGFVLSFHVVWLFLICLMASDAVAQTRKEKWQFTFAPYLMGASMDGNTTIRGREAEIDLSAGDIFDNLKFGFMGYFEAEKGKWGFGSDTTYMSLGAFTEIPSANVNVKQLAWTFWGIREMSPWADLMFGARWNRIDGELDLKNLNVQVGDTKNWVDPLIGVRLTSDRSRRLHAGILADIGGFGVGSDFAWELYPTVGVNLGRHATISFGYRWLDTDYETGEGSERFGYDVLAQGPTLGFSFSF